MTRWQWRDVSTVRPCGRVRSRFRLPHTGRRSRHLISRLFNISTSNERSNKGIENAMTKRAHDSIASLPYAAPSDRQPYDVEGEGSHEDGEGTSLKKPRSFMATLVCKNSSKACRRVADLLRPVIYVVPGRHDVTRTGQNVGTVEP